MMLDDCKRKMYRMMFNLQQRRWDLFVDWFDSWAIHEDSLLLILLIELNSLFLLICFIKIVTILVLSDSVF